MNGYRIAGVAIIMVGFLMSFGLAFGVPPIIKGAIGGVGGPLDGSATCSNSSTCFLSLTTSNANDVIIVEQASNLNGNCGPPATPTASGLTFTFRARSNAGIGYSNQNVCEYYAISSAPLVSASIACSPGYTNGRTSCIAFGISGANTASPFDLSAPCTNFGTSSTPSCSVTTTNPNDFIIGLSTTTTPTTATSGTGFATIFDQSSDNNGNSFAEYGTVSTLQQSAPVGLTYATSTSWGMIADAIKQGQSTTTTSSTTTTPAAGQVTQPVSFTPQNGAAQVSVALSQCAILNPSSVTGNGVINNVAISPNCFFAATLPSGYYFNAGPPTSGPVSTLTLTSCASGICQPWTPSYFSCTTTPVTASVCPTTTITTTITITSSGTVTTSVITTTVTSASSANPFVLPAAWTVNPFNFVVGLLLIPSGVIVYTRKNEGG